MRQKFSLVRKKSAGILCVFQTFLTKTSGNLCREDGRGDLFRGSLECLPFDEERLIIIKNIIIDKSGGLQMSENREEQKVLQAVEAMYQDYTIRDREYYPDFHRE